MKVCIVVGTRPQIIKSQPIIKEILSKKVDLSVIHTGQHYDYKMSKIFFEELQIKDPDFNLNVGPNTPAKQLAEIIIKLEKPLTKISPDVVLVPGDTRSALGAAICSNKLGIKTAHIEAGARSMEFGMEEEINRRMIDHSSNILFAPTMNCYNNLQKESVPGSIFFTGDTMFDVFLQFKKILNLQKTLNKKYILVTLHRRDNITNRTKFKQIINFIREISNGYDVIFPIHPHTKKQLLSFNISLKEINTIDPVKYSDMLKLLSNASLLITDSGGLQKESYWSDTPCVTLRKSTEWIETLDGKHNVLLKTITKSNTKTVRRLLDGKSLHKNKMLFGNGKAATKICSILLHGS